MPAHLITAVHVVLCATAPVETPPDLIADWDAMQLTVGSQRVEFRQRDARPDSPLDLCISVRQDGAWIPVFDAPRPLVSGALFDLQPTHWEVVADSPDRKAAELRGVHPVHGYSWALLVEATTHSPFLRFSLQCDLPKALPLSDPQPTIAFWMREPAVDLAIDQGPQSYAREFVAGWAPFSYGLPAAYVWDGGREAMVYFELSPMQWMSFEGIARFRDCRVMSHAVDGCVGLGLHTRTRTGDRLPAGRLAAEWYLLAQSRPERPTDQEALATLLGSCALLYPAEAPTAPLTNAPPHETTWTAYAREAVKALSSPKVLCDELALDPVWRDEPARLVEPIARARVHYDRPNNATRDFSSVNNHLSGWALYTQLHPEDAEAAALLREKAAGVALFYDPRSGLLRHNITTPSGVGEVGMSWQDMYYHVEPMRTLETIPPSAFSPAMAGRTLMSLEGLISYAHNVDYLFPLFFNAVAKQAAAPSGYDDYLAFLREVREPWQAGSYAYAMVLAHRVTNEARYLDEASAALNMLLRKLRYTETNEKYTAELNRTVDFPITEIFGNGYGAAAAYRLHERTGDATYLAYARECLYSLLRMNHWFEDESDEVARALRNRGLFTAHGGNWHACPWETSEAQLALADALDKDPDLPLTRLLLRMSNHQRISGFHFYPAALSPELLARTPVPFQFPYIPIEPFYILEGGPIGHTVWEPATLTGQAAYMAGHALWNYWLFEALARVDAGDVLVMNLAALDGYQAALTGSERRFIVYNPRPSDAAVTLRHLSLPAGIYTLRVAHERSTASLTEYTHTELTHGVPLSVPPDSYVRVTLNHQDAARIQASVATEASAMNTLSHAYCEVQLLAQRGPDSPEVGELRTQFADAMKQFGQARYDDARLLAERIIEATGGVAE